MNFSFYILPPQYPLPQAWADVTGATGCGVILPHSGGAGPPPSELACLGVEELPGPGLFFRAGALPTPEWPSDHVSLCAQFSLRF